jgi:lipocalin-like protein
VARKDRREEARVKAEHLAGTWRLRSWKNVGSDGSAIDPLGEKPIGYIFYNLDGYMSVEIMAAHRVPYREPDPFGGTPEERSEAISTYLSYAGRFDVLPDQDTVIHHIEVCSYPNWIGNAQVRFAELDGDLLTLSTEPMTFQGVERTAELVWERVAHD